MASGSSFAAIAVLAVLALCIVMYISTSGSMSGGGVQATMVDHKLSSILTALERSGSGPSEKFQHIEEMVQSTQKEMHEVHDSNWLKHNTGVNEAAEAIKKMGARMDSLTSQLGRLEAKLAVAGAPPKPPRKEGGPEPGAKCQTENCVLYFNIAHENNQNEPHQKNNKIQGCLETWCKRVPGGVVWYSNKYDPDIKNHVIQDPNGNAQELYFRVKLIWKHVWETYPNYDWYFRLWDDNFVVVENVKYAVEGLDPNEPWVVGLSFGAFMSGGAGWLVSKQAMKQWMPKIDQCDSWGPPKKLCDRGWWCEDVILGNCLADAGVKSKGRSHMFWPNSWDWRGFDYQEYDRDHLGCKTKEDFEKNKGDCQNKMQCLLDPKHKDENKDNFRPVVFHYMTLDKQRAVEKVMYGQRNKC